MKGPQLKGRERQREGAAQVLGLRGAGCPEHRARGWMKDQAQEVPARVGHYMGSSQVLETEAGLTMTDRSKDSIAVS